jgi:hypothetical protein
MLLYSTIKKLLFLLLFLLLAIPYSIQSQDIAIGQWRHHLPNNIVVSLDEKPGFIYAATPYGLLEFDKEFNSITKYDKVNGLSDFGINVTRYVPGKDLLLMGYQNGLIDVMRNGTFFTVPDISQSNIIGSRAINNILIDQERAYLSCDFGIVVLDLNSFVILDTWFVGQQGSALVVYDLAKTSTHFYAATASGLLKAGVTSPNLADYRYWNPDAGLPDPTGRFTQVELHNNFLLANQVTPAGDIMYIRSQEEWNAFTPTTYYNFYSQKTNLRSANGMLIVSSMAGMFYFDENMNLTGEHFWYLNDRVYAYDAFRDSQGIIWIADRGKGLVKHTPNTGFESIVAAGPLTAGSYGITHNNGLWVATGGPHLTWSDRGVMLFRNGKWSIYNRYQFSQINEVRDFHTVIAHPGNPSRVFAAAWAGGLMEFDADEGLVAYYDHNNSSLQRRGGVNDYIQVGGGDWDSKGNLWVSNSAADHFLSVKKANGEWLSFPHNGNVGSIETVNKVVVDNYDQKWVSMARGGGIIVFRETSLENNPSFDITRLTTQAGRGSLPSTRVTALAKDKDGYIWAGTNEGVAVFYSPQMALRGQSFDAQSIIVVQDGFAAKLFDGETINTIFVDGSNKKWFGTLGSGAFLQSADGRETILHFNRSNSPLPSNNILDISVDPNTGEVFFATDRGLVSFRGFATEGVATHSNVFAFPNPVRPGYSGYIAIKGLVSNARVKITDIAGNLVYDGFAEGGQFVWDGSGVHGRRPHSGVYLVFSTNTDGTETMVTKILFMQ